MQNARKEPRRDLALALEIDDVGSTPESRRGRMGVLRNLSKSGLLVNTPTRFEPGSRVAIRVHARDGGIAKFDAKVARVEECGSTSPEPWRYRVALKFSGLLPLGARRRSALLLAV